MLTTASPLGTGRAGRQVMRPREKREGRGWSCQSGTNRGHEDHKQFPSVASVSAARPEGTTALGTRHQVLWAPQEDTGGALSYERGHGQSVWESGECDRAQPPAVRPPRAPLGPLHWPRRTRSQPYAPVGTKGDFAVILNLAPRSALRIFCQRGLL